MRILPARPMIPSGSWKVDRQTEYVLKHKQIIDKLLPAIHPRAKHVT
jgi:hypothetical protein